MSKNETLTFRDHVYEIEARKPKAEKVKALPEDRQELFTYLCNLSGEQFKEAINEWRQK
jgi:hypothetical protein